MGAGSRASEAQPAIIIELWRSMGVDKCYTIKAILSE